MRFTLDTAATDYPVSVEIAKQHLNISHTDDDQKISRLIKSATVQTENYLSRALMTQTWLYNLDEFPALDAPIAIPKPPLQSVTHIKYYDDNGDQQTFSSSLYTVDTSGFEGRVFLNYNQSWPTVRSIQNTIEIKFVAGYSSAALVPEDIKTAIMMLVATQYAFTENVVSSPRELRELPQSSTYLLHPYRIFPI